jgi:hypothetical protein
MHELFMIMKRVFFIFLLFPVLYGCNQDEPAMVRINDQFSLELDDQVKIVDDRNHSLYVSLVEIEENRCPSDAFCVQAGQVLVKVVIEDTRNSQFSTLLCLGDCSPSITSLKSFIFYNTEFTLELLEVNPFPTTSNRENKRNVILKLTRN